MPEGNLPFNIESQEERANFLKFLKNNENKARKQESLKQFEIYNDRLNQYVKEHLQGRFTENTVREMPIIDSINLSRRIVKDEASIYNTPPERLFSELSDDQREKVNLIYRDMRIDKLNKKANELFKVQHQTLIQILPKEGKLSQRVLWSHNYDAIPDPEDPERSVGYVLSAMDKSDLISDSRPDNTTGTTPRSQLNFSRVSDRINQPHAEKDDFRSKINRFVWWTKDYNFITDEKGNILEDGKQNNSADIDSPVMGTLPFVDVSSDKDFEYFVRQGNAVTDFTVEYNGQLSAIAQIVLMQGFAQAWMKGPADLLPENVQVGPNLILKLPIDPENPTDSDFGFANPNPDLQGSIEFLEVLVSNFLTSRGKDPKIISGKAQSNTYSSAAERWIAMLEQFEATQEDFAIFKGVEDEQYKIVKAWHNADSNGDLLDPKYKTTELSEDSQVAVKFHSPEKVQSEDERLDNWEKKIDLGIASQVDALMDDRGIKDRDEARELFDKIQDENLGIRNGSDPTGRPNSDSE